MCGNPGPSIYQTCTTCSYILLSVFRSSKDGVVETLEVVTLSSDVPVTTFAHQNQLPVHTWPPGDLSGRFDVGVVVSFGCLLKEGLIKQFP